MNPRIMIVFFMVFLFDALPSEHSRHGWYFGNFTYNIPSKKFPFKTVGDKCEFRWKKKSNSYRILGRIHDAFVRFFETSMEESK